MFDVLLVDSLIRFQNSARLAGKGMPVGPAERRYQDGGSFSSSQSGNGTPFLSSALDLLCKIALISKSAAGLFFCDWRN